jgi:hypothetical protein
MRKVEDHEKPIASEKLWKSPDQGKAAEKKIKEEVHKIWMKADSIHQTADKMSRTGGISAPWCWLSAFNPNSLSDEPECELEFHGPAELFDHETREGKSIRYNSLSDEVTHFIREALILGWKPVLSFYFTTDPDCYNASPMKF